MIAGFGASDVGKRRQLNEDAVLVDDRAGLYIVADGMGGHNAGEVASRLSVEVVSSFIERSREDEEITWPFGLDPERSFRANCLRTAVMLANQTIWKQAEDREEYAGMGTTIVVALVEGEVITLCSAGDSRAYRLRGERLEQLTVDDSLVQTAVSEGILSSKDLQNHPMKNVITKALGARDTIEPNLREEELQEGDVYLLCSDGLHGMLSDDEIARILVDAGDDEKKAVSELIRAANDTGGKDNITAIVLRYRES